MHPVKKIDTLRNLMNDSKWKEALSLASKFPRLGEEKEIITRAHGCIVNPSFYKQIGIDIDASIQLGINALKSKYA